MMSFWLVNMTDALLLWISSPLKQLLLLKIQPDKCEVLVPPDLNDAALKPYFDRNFALSFGSIPLLGSAVGMDQSHIKNWLEQEVTSWKRTLAMIARQELPVQLSLLLSRWVITAK